MPGRRRSSAAAPSAAQDHSPTKRDASNATCAATASAVDGERSGGGTGNVDGRKGTRAEPSGGVLARTSSSGEALRAGPEISGRPVVFGQTPYHPLSGALTFTAARQGNGPIDWTSWTHPYGSLQVAEPPRFGTCIRARLRRMRHRHQLSGSPNPSLHRRNSPGP